ncbi:MAG: tRNA uridine-5-carboxymethylaminomethyl(34) synthesis GTPase MnmE [Elusimicrobia bacterium]|nr:tRNA uridine-5-carboxymethylaminomethyl(34) synthesis GTPase MnmE [Elusimicrobiota bacterium]
MRDTIAALATPPGAGAVALVRVSGPAAWETAASFLDLKSPPEPRRQTLAWALDGDARLDQVLVTLFSEGASYTGEETVELACHGSPYVVERLLELARAAGARQARPGEFTQRAYLAGRVDLAQAEAVCDLIAAASADEHRAALLQLDGGLSRRVEALRAGLLDLAALVEANLDHPDEDLPPVDPAAAAARAAALAEQASELSVARRRGRPGRRAPRLVLLGAPNAGKSSLLNALLGEDRVLVSPEPGTTRDAVEAPAVLAGLSCAVVDTAGLRERPADELERLGQERSRAEARSADLALIVVDRTGPPEEARRLAAEAAALTGADRLAGVLSKCDLAGAAVRAADLGGLETVEVSALTGTGLLELTALARRRLGAFGGEAFSVSERHAAALSSAEAALRRAAGELKAAREELAARELRAALAALDSIVGRDTPEETLAAVFSRFCVGK